jgi:hypothetical protein
MCLCTPLLGVCGTLYYLVASFVEGLGGLIPTKTSRAIAQFFGRVSSDVIISFHVEVTSCKKVWVRFIFRAVILSSCSLLFRFVVHRFVIVSWVNTVPLIVLSHLIAHMRCADSDTIILINLEAPFIGLFFWLFSCSLSCSSFLTLMLPHPRMVPMPILGQAHLTVTAYVTT